MAGGECIEVGGYRVTRLFDGTFHAPIGSLVHPAGQAHVDAVAGELGLAAIALPVNCFLLEGGDGITLVDAGCGSVWGETYGFARAALAAAGVSREMVRRVLLTHLHGDHAYGLVDGDGAWFPNAEILVPEADMAFFTDPAAQARVATARRGGFQVASRLVAVAGDAIRRIGSGPVLPGISCQPLPGHSPGHCGYQIGEGPGSLLLWGDVLHDATLQPRDPDLGFVFDLDPAAGIASRRRALDQAATGGLVVSGGHIDGFMRVERAGGSFRMMPV